MLLGLGHWMVLHDVGGLWALLHVAGVWVLLGVIGCCCMLLGVVGCYCMLLGVLDVVGCCWMSLGCCMSLGITDCISLDAVVGCSCWMSLDVVGFWLLGAAVLSDAVGCCSIPLDAAGWGWMGLGVVGC